MNLFRFFSRLQSVRHPFRDYGLPGSYFITICTKFRVPYFGTITNGRMDLSSVGKIAAFELTKTMKIRDTVVVDTWAIMPNHIHAIIRLLPASGPQSDNLPAIVRGFKSAVKKWTNLYGLDLRWQARYHDHIVRNDGELERIRWYIRNNERVWGSDSLNR
ncbi:MAG: transposase [bacterium]